MQVGQKLDVNRLGIATLLCGVAIAVLGVASQATAALQTSNPTVTSTPPPPPPPPGFQTPVPTPTPAASPTPSPTPALTPILYNGVDIAPIVQRAKREIKTVTRPFKLYNWTPRGALKYWKNAKGSHDPIFAKNAQILATLFWRAWGSADGLKNMYGQGLYAALDPVATWSYSRGTNYPGSDDFQLIEMTIPKGFKFIQLYSSFGPPEVRRTDWSLDEDTALNDAMKAFDCPEDGSNDIFTNGAASTDAKCQKVFKYIYKDILKVDGLAYDYSARFFLQCDAATRSQSQNYYNSTTIAPAFVIMSPDWMTPENIAFYNRYTTDAVEERRQIQTLFMGTSTAESTKTDLSALARPAIKRLLTANPTYAIKNAKTTCSSYRCSMVITACKPDFDYASAAVSNYSLSAYGYCAGEEVTLPLRSSPIITQAGATTTEPNKLLWNDLDNQPKSTPAVTGQWLNMNRLGCDGTMPYENTYPDAQKKAGSY